MALTVPPITELETFKNEEVPSSDEQSVTAHLQAATDLMELATGIHTDFEPGTLEARVMRRGILDLTWYIGTSMEDRDSLFSPFSSERIGSYSYSKAASAISMRGKTGVPFFDLAVDHLSGLNESLAATYSQSEHVMPVLSWYGDRDDSTGFGVRG